MSVRSKKRRRLRRKAERAAWAAIGERGALVAPDVWERLKRQVAPAEGVDLPVFLMPRGIPIEVCSMLRPGTVMAKPPPIQPFLYGRI